MYPRLKGMPWDGYTSNIQHFEFLQDAAAASSSEGAIGAYVGSSFQYQMIYMKNKQQQQQQQRQQSILYIYIYVIWYNGRMYKKLLYNLCNIIYIVCGS